MSSSRPCFEAECRPSPACPTSRRPVTIFSSNASMAACLPFTPWRPVIYAHDSRLHRTDPDPVAADMRLSGHRLPAHAHANLHPADARHDSPSTPRDLLYRVFAVLHSGDLPRPEDRRLDCQHSRHRGGARRRAGWAIGWACGRLHRWLASLFAGRSFGPCVHGIDGCRRPDRRTVSLLHDAARPL